MELLRSLLWTLLVTLVATKVLCADDCPASPEGFADEVIQAVCSYNSSGPEAATFKNETRSSHGVFNKTDNDNTFALLPLFNPNVITRRCISSCGELVSRENVTWCIRLSDVNRRLETCISVGDNGEIVSQPSSCDAHNLKLENYLTLPTAEECGDDDAGCLGLTNLNWFFKDAYLTCIAETDTCRDITFTQIITHSILDQPPSISAITPSPVTVKPFGQIVLRAEILSSNFSLFVSWHHGKNIYNQHIREDPFCDPDREGACGNDTHPDGEILRSKRIRSYSIQRTISAECVGSSVYSLETYLVIDGATEIDAGTYVVNASIPQQTFLPVTEEVNVEFVCDEAATVLHTDNCPASPEGFDDEVIQAVCSYNGFSPTSASFRNETRSNHCVFSKTDGDNRYVPLLLFNPVVVTRRCRSSCDELLSRENVTWCARLSDVNRTLETCISVGDNGEIVSRPSSCDAHNLKLENYLTLPTAEECGVDGAGCLGLTNLNWFFKDAYLTCIAETDTCRDVVFTQIITRSILDQPPSISAITSSPLIVNPHGQIVIRAEILSTSFSLFVSWHHGNNTYEQHILEDPFCDPVREGVCGNYTHPNGEVLRSKRIRSYSMLRTIKAECVGSTVYSLETYLVIDNATESDAGTYVVNATIQQHTFLPVTKKVKVVVVCDESSFYKANCSNSTIAMQKGSNYKWHCDFIAPKGLEVMVVQNKSLPVKHFDLDGNKTLEELCSFDDPTAVYDVDEVDDVCYNKYTVNIIICGVSENLVGNYSVVSRQGEEIRRTQGSGVFVKIPQNTFSHSSSGSKKEEEEEVSPAAYIAPVVALICALVGIVILLVVLIRRRKRKRRQGHLSQLHSPDPVMSPEAAFYKKSGQFSPISLLSPQSTCAAFSDPLEFPRNQLYVYTKKVLGEGSFGRVLQAKAEGIVPGMPDRNIVAIKTTKDNATSVETEELLAELDLMRNIEPHENILNLLGQCTTPGGPVCLIVEYARYGNLRDFLRQCEEVVLSLNHKPHIPRHRSRTGTFSSSSAGSFQPLISRQDSSVFTPGSVQHQFVFPFPSPPSHKMSTSSSSSTTDSKATAHHPRTATVPLAHSVAPIGHDYINSKGLVYMEDVHNFALQISCGLQHLAGLQIVHCDLAARNVLIAEGFVLKIADFGLARDISGREMYKKNPRGKIPVKWTAPEALENRIFTTKSDVWSFGVVLWELFTYGHTPYPDLHLGQSYDAIISYLKEGNRMSQPDSCSDEFYELMLKCWSLDPDERPTPIDIVATLTPLDGPNLNGISDMNED